MQEWQSEWQTIKELIGTLNGSCVDFGLSASPPMDTTTVEEDLNEKQTSRSLFEEFVTKLEELMDQTWLELRPPLYMALDMSQEWLVKLKDVPRDNITHGLAQQEQGLGTAFSGLKNMSGEPLGRDHWKLPFGILRILGDTKLDAPTLRSLAGELDLITEQKMSPRSSPRGPSVRSPSVT